MIASNPYSQALHSAESLISQVMGMHIPLSVMQVLDSKHTVLRCQLHHTSPHAPQTVILKQLPFDEGAKSSPLLRFLNEWTALEFISGLPGDTHFAPRFYLGDHRAQLMLIEDLGDHPTLQDLLYGNDPDLAERHLYGFATLLGRLHSTSRRHETDFLRLQRHLNANVPYSDTVLDLREHLAQLWACLKALRIRVPQAAFMSEVFQIESVIHEPGYFRVLSHNDAGPHNAIWTPYGMKLIDFEFAQFQHALIDACGARMGFPTALRGRPLPYEMVETFEAIYRLELIHAVPHAADDSVFYSGMVKACAHWLLSRMLGAGALALRYQILLGGSDHLPSAMSVERAQLLRQFFLNWSLAFIATADRFGYLPVIRSVAEQMAWQLQQQWHDLHPTPIYPLLATSDAH